MGYSCAGIEPNPLSIVTQKSVPDIRGEVVWILCGEGKPRRYGICARFIATSIEAEPDGSTIVAGDGTLLKREIPLNDEPWFKQFLSDYQNFSLGFREIKERAYIDEFERLMGATQKSRSSAPKKQPAERPKQAKEQPAAAASKAREETRPAPPSASPVADAPIDVFIAYSRKDEESRDEVEKILKVISRDESIKYWHPGMIEPGSERQAEIKQNLDRSRLILLLISSDFMASDELHDVQAEAMKRRTADKATVIPIIVRACGWEDTPFAEIRSLPDDPGSVDKWSSKDAAFKNIGKGIRRAIAKLRSEPLPT